jgi:hypothetical protein
MFTLMGRDFRELWPPMDLMIILQMLYEHGEPQWNDTDRVKHKKS